MERPTQEPASLRSAIGAVLALPAVVAFVVPWGLAAVDAAAGGWSPWGLVVTVVGVAVLASTVAAFFTQGRGTLAPWNPPRRLVTTGLFARCRNPMYVGVVTTVVGHAWTCASPVVGGYAVVLAVGFHVRVVTFEEPWAARTFPEEWPAYRANVPRWLPRLRPWRGPGDGPA